jgi:hypothetical protein
LAQLLAADFLPPVWLPDERTRSLRRQVMRRAHVVRQPAWGVLDEELRPVTLGDDFVAEPHPDPGARSAQRMAMAAGS